MKKIKLLTSIFCKDQWDRFAHGPHCPKYLATFRDIEWNVTAKKSYTRETFEIGVPIHALKLQLTDLGTFRGPPHAIPLHAARISRNVSWFTFLGIKMMHRVRLELGPDNLQARTLTASLSCLDKNTVKKSIQILPFLGFLPSTQLGISKLNHHGRHFFS